MRRSIGRVFQAKGTVSAKARWQVCTWPVGEGKKGVHDLISFRSNCPWLPGGSREHSQETDLVVQVTDDDGSP